MNSKSIKNISKKKWTIWTICSSFKTQILKFKKDKIWIDIIDNHLMKLIIVLMNQIHKLKDLGRPATWNQRMSVKCRKPMLKNGCKTSINWSKFDVYKWSKILFLAKLQSQRSRSGLISSKLKQVHCPKKNILSSKMRTHLLDSPIGSSAMKIELKGLG